MTHEIFCYGTLMFPEVWKAILGFKRLKTQKAVLKHWSCRKIYGECFPGIVPESGAYTSGVVMQGVCLNSLKVLDGYEGGLYQRRILTIYVEGQPRLAQVYVLTNAARRLASTEVWCAEEFSVRELKQFCATL
ncbi:MAG: gamma-glutamylcyclotransferase [Hahellaceae bacterium]|nr:gamma-glutamylcyclotransferase [Hahellaceae bacterium]MCP5170539.1 gamma-glutamylcyclotransferase [Hahellaceae bacterium]